MTSSLSRSTTTERRHCHVIIHGEGADALPCDETHLVVSTFRRACATSASADSAHAGSDQQHPSGRGMGSSAEAIVAGIAARRGLRPDR